MATSLPVDPMELQVALALRAAGIPFLPDRDGLNPSGLDFSLPEERVEIEVKRMHSPRIAEQMARVPDVIVAQGPRAVAFLARAIAALGAIQPEQDPA